MGFTGGVHPSRYGRNRHRHPPPHSCRACADVGECVSGGGARTFFLSGIDQGSQFMFVVHRSPRCALLFVTHSWPSMQQTLPPTGSKRTPPLRSSLHQRSLLPLVFVVCCRTTSHDGAAGCLLQRCDVLVCLMWCDQAHPPSTQVWMLVDSLPNTSTPSCRFVAANRDERVEPG